MKPRLFLVALALLGACAAPVPDLPVKPTSRGGDAGFLLAYARSLRDLPQAELVRALADLGTQEPTPRIQLQKAMVVAAGHNAGSADLLKAYQLADTVAQAGDSAGAALKPLAQFLADSYADRRRLVEQAEKLAQQNREQQRRNEQLTQTLEALKAIERTLPAK